MLSSENIRSEVHMSLLSAIEKARENSKGGYVKHVNRVISGSGENYYVVSDWYDADNTVASFENGKGL